MKTSVSLTVIHELFNHYYWARDRQLFVCAKLTNDQFLKPLGSSFSSLRDTLVHMAVVEKIWLERFRGKTPSYNFNPQSYPDIGTLQKFWQEVEKDSRAFLSIMNEAELENTITVVSTRGQQWTQPLWRYILHLLNHQSYHRGQVTTMLRQLKVQPARVDFLDALDVEFKI